MDNLCDIKKFCKGKVVVFDGWINFMVDIE